MFGRTVNLAARVADAAPDGRLYVPASVATRLDGDVFLVASVGDATLPGIGPVALVDVARAS